MERITAKEVTSMMQAVAQVYEQQDAEQIDENRGAAATANRERRERERIEADRRTQAAGGGAAAEKAELERLRKANVRSSSSDRRFRPRSEQELIRQARYNVRQQGLKNLEKNPDYQPPEKTSTSTPAETEPSSQNTAPAGAFNVSPKGSEKRNEVEAQIKRDNAARTDDERVQPKPQAQQPQQRPQSPSSNLKPGNPNVAVSPKTGEETKFERRMPTMAELRAAQAARAKAKAAGASDKEAGYQATKAGVGVAQGTVKDPKIAADANRKAELERIRQRAASQTRAGVRPTVASTADSKSRTAAGIMSNKSASGSGPGGYQLSFDARPKSNVGRVASKLANSDAKPAATSSSTPAVKAPASAAASPAGTGSVASRLAAIRAARPAATQPTTAKPAPAPSTTGATTTPTVKPVSTTPPAQVRGREAMMARQKNPRNRNTQLNQGDPMERMTGKGAASLMETYSKVYEEREPQAIDEGIVGALKKVAKIGAAAAGAVAGGKALEKATSSKEPTRDQRDAADAKMHLDFYRKTGKMMTNKSGYKLPERTPANAKNVEYYKDDVDLFDVIKGHLIDEHNLSEDVALQLMYILDEETRADIMEYTASMSAGKAGATAKMTADGKEPIGDRLMQGIAKKVGGLLQKVNPNALKSKKVEPRKPLVQQNNSFEPNGDLVDEGIFDFLPKQKTVVPAKYGKDTVLAKKGGVEGVLNKKTGEFTAQKGGFDKIDAERYSNEYMKQRPRGMGDPTTSHANRRVTPNRVK